ncbi:hypothetical protein ACFVRD_33050 [Streptomyces sp. NPDC057908]|uniref:hypothetical protein n=1 Tax=Streptomyces sp. NPDC057908 TaxID=3346276 RepID=UPI0036EC4535
MVTTQKNFKIVSAVEKTNAEKIADLSEFLAANVEVRTVDGEFEKAAVFQQHPAIFELTVAHSRDRI